MDHGPKACELALLATNGNWSKDRHGILWQLLSRGVDVTSEEGNIFYEIERRGVFFSDAGERQWLFTSNTPVKTWSALPNSAHRWLKGTPDETSSIFIKSAPTGFVWPRFAPLHISTRVIEHFSSKLKSRDLTRSHQLGWHSNQGKKKKRDKLNIQLIVQIQVKSFIVRT